MYAVEPQYPGSSLLEAGFVQFIYFWVTPHVQTSVVYVVFFCFVRDATRVILSHCLSHSLHLPCLLFETTDH